MILAGCVSQVQVVEDPIRMFNKEYYAVKDLTPSDIWKMKEILASDDIGGARSAGLILGRHYVRNGEVGKGYELIKGNLDDSYLDKYMKASGHIWAYDAAVKMKDTETAEKEKAYINKMDMDEKTEKAVRVYCGQEKKDTSGVSGKSCIFGTETKTAAPEQKQQEVIVIPPKTEKAPEKKPEAAAKSETLKKKLLINVKESVKNPELVEAMLYSVSKLKMNADLDFEGEKGGYDYIVDASDRSIGYGVNKIDFTVDRKKQIKKTADLVINDGAKKIAIGYTEGLRDTAAEIADEYKNQADFYLFNIQDRDFQAKLNEIKNKIGKNSGLSYILVGSQTQVLKVVPFLKYYSPKPDRTVVGVAIDSLSKKFYSGEYAEYTRNAIVVTDILLAENANAENFSGSFSKDFGKVPGLNDMLGYDMMIYMEKARNPEYKNEYLTGIIKADDSGVTRKTGAYRILSGGKLKKLD